MTEPEGSHAINYKKQSESLMKSMRNTSPFHRTEHKELFNAAYNFYFRYVCGSIGSFIERICQFIKFQKEKKTNNTHGNKSAPSISSGASKQAGRQASNSGTNKRSRQINE